MAQFKVKYKTRLKLQRAIQSQIKQKGLTQDWAMHDSIRVASVVGDLNKINITINAIYYYMFQDLGATDAGASRTVDIRPNYITRAAMNSPQGQAFLNEVVQEYITFLTDNYPLLEVARLKINPDVTLGFNLFGDPDGRWNGFFEYDEVFKVTWN